jgi:hypothetical protein
VRLGEGCCRHLLAGLGTDLADLDGPALHGDPDKLVSDRDDRARLALDIAEAVHGMLSAPKQTHLVARYGRPGTRRRIAAPDHIRKSE